MSSPETSSAPDQAAGPSLGKDTLASAPPPVGAMTQIANAMDGVTDRIGKVVALLTLYVVLVCFAAVVIRYGAVGLQEWLGAPADGEDPGFFYGILQWMRDHYVQIQESYNWAFGMMFMAGAAYTFLHEGHVRVDVFYRGASERYKAWIDLLGTLFLMFPMMLAIGWFSYDYVIKSWAGGEGSREAGGLPALYILKTFLWVFVIFMVWQGISRILRCLAVLTGEARSINPRHEHIGEV